MPIDTSVDHSPGWWLKVLSTELHNRRTGRGPGGRTWHRDQVASSNIRPGLDLLEQYRRGNPPLRDDIHSGWAAPYRQFVRMGRLNFGKKLVRPTTNRMGLRGFRTAADADELGDAVAHEILLANRLKLVARDVHNDMVGLADGYALVTPPGQDPDDTIALITAESPLQCITAQDPATGRTLAGLKVFRDELAGEDLAYLYLAATEVRTEDGSEAEAAQLWRAVKPGASTVGGLGHFRWARTWEWRDAEPVPIPGKRCPLVRFQNEDGVGEIEQHLDHLDRINDKIFNEWWISKIQAFRQRAIERNLKEGEDEDPDRDDQDPDSLTPEMSPEQVADLFVSAPDALWDLPPGAKMWESESVDVRPLIESITTELKWLALAADLSLSAFTSDSVNQSADGSNNQKEEHLFKVEDRRDRAEGSWAEVLSLAFEYQGDTTRSKVTDIRVIWGPSERYSLEQKARAGSQAGNLPRKAQLRDIWQYDPADIPELMQMYGTDLLFQVPGQPPRPGVTR